MSKLYNRYFFYFVSALFAILAIISGASQFTGLAVTCLLLSLLCCVRGAMIAWDKTKKEADDLSDKLNEEFRVFQTDLTDINDASEYDFTKIVYYEDCEHCKADSQLDEEVLKPIVSPAPKKAKTIKKKKTAKKAKTVAKKKKPTKKKSR